MILCISGPVDPPPYEQARDWYRRAFGYMEGAIAPDVIMSGAAYGVDTDALRAALIFWPTIKVMFALPNAPYNLAFVRQVGDEHLGPVEAHHVMSNDELISKRYMARNDWMADHANALVAFPRTSLETIRSGTWSTVRRFRKRNRYVELFPFDDFLAMQQGE